MYRLAAIPIAACLAASCAPIQRAPSPVQLDPVVGKVDPSATRQAIIYPPRAEGAPADQYWSLLGREDRGAAAGGRDYVAQTCEVAAGADSAVGVEKVLDHIAERAANHRIVILNESHSNTFHRRFSQMLIERLRPLGYTVFAAEAFENRADEPDPVTLHANRTYPAQELGYYTREPQFGRLVRTAMALDYRLAAYEQAYSAMSDAADDPATSVNSREEAQARNLAETLAAMPEGEKLFVHVGYSHAKETPQPYEESELRWMALQLKEMTGLDPLTISQTTCRGSTGDTRLASAPADMPPATFDLLVDHPLPRFNRGRLAWRLAAGDMAVPIPAVLRPDGEPLVIEAFAEGEPFDAVPYDRVYVEPGEDVPLLLPPGRYSVRAVRVQQ